jgi:hypothetical protein
MRSNATPQRCLATATVCGTRSVALAGSGGDVDDDPMAQGAALVQDVHVFFQLGPEIDTVDNHVAQRTRFEIALHEKGHVPLATAEINDNLAGPGNFFFFFFSMNINLIYVALQSFPRG